MILSRRNVIVIISIVAIVGTVIVMRTMRGSSAVDDYVAQLRAKGERFYVTDAPLPKMTNGTPGLDKLVSAADSLVSYITINVMDVNTSGVAVVAWQGLPQVDGVRSNSVQWDYLLAKLKKNDNALQQIRESVATTEPDSGWETNFAMIRRTFVQQRRASQMLATATIGALYQTNYNDAFENLQALARLAQMERDGTTLVSQMIRVAIAGLGLATTWEALQSDGLSDAQWSQLQAEWGKLDLLKTVENGFVGERFLVFNHIEMARKGETNAVNWTGKNVSWRDRARTAIWRATVAQQDEMYYLKTLEQYIAHCRSVSNGTPAVLANTLFSNDTARLERDLARPFSGLRYPFSMIAIPNFTRAAATAFQNETQRRMAITAIGIKRYQMRHGKLPETLQALVPDCCPEVLLDPMDLKPLRYRTNNDGTFLLYSVGNNGKDDGGTAAYATNAPSGWLNGLDIVWPRAPRTNANNQYGPAPL